MAAPYSRASGYRVFDHLFWSSLWQCKCGKGIVILIFDILCLFQDYFFSVVLSTILSLLTQISIQAIANAIDVPVWVERQTVDLKICMYDRLYQDTIIVNNRWVDNNLTPWLLEKQMNLLFSKPKILYLSIFFIEQPLPWGWSLKYAKSWRTIWNCCQKQATFRLSPTSQHKWSFCQGNNS